MKEYYCKECGIKLNIFNKKQNFTDYYCKKCFKLLQKQVSQERISNIIKSVRIIDTHSNETKKTLQRGVAGYILLGELGSYIGMLTAKGETTVVFLVEYEKGRKESVTAKIGSARYNELIKYLQ